MIEVVTPSVTWRDVRYGDENAIQTILSDWRHDTNTDRPDKPFDARRAAHTVDKLVKDMHTQPGDHPILPDSVYREGFICFHPTDGDPLAMYQIVCRGGNNRKNPRAPLSCLTIEIIAIAKKYRRTPENWKETLFPETLKVGHEFYQPDIICGESASDEINTRAESRGWSKERERDKPNRGTRTEFALTRAEAAALMQAQGEDQIVVTFSVT